MKTRVTTVTMDQNPMKLPDLMLRYHHWVRSVDRIMKLHLGQENPYTRKILKEIRNEAQAMTSTQLLCLDNRVYFRGNMIELFPSTLLLKLFTLFSDSNGVVRKNTLLEYVYEMEKSDLSRRQVKCLNNAANKLICRARRICLFHFDDPQNPKFSWLVYDIAEKSYCFAYSLKERQQLIFT